MPTTIINKDPICQKCNFGRMRKIQGFIHRRKCDNPYCGDIADKARYKPYGFASKDKNKKIGG